MANRIDGYKLNDFVKRVDRNGNNLVDASEARVLGQVGNRNGANGTRETSDALVNGQAAVADFALSAADADAVSSELAGGDAWVSQEDVFISDAARARLDINADNRVSRKELADGLQRGGLAISGDGITLSSEAAGRFGSSRPTPPPVDRPTPPPVGRPTPPPIDRPTPPPVYDPGTGSDRPVPPAVHVPRYYWQPTFPIMLPSDPRQVPQIALPPTPAPARQVGLNEVSNDPVKLLAEKERLRGYSKHLFITSHPKLNEQEANQALDKKQTIYLAPDGGVHKDSTYQPINNRDQLKPLLPGLRQDKLQELQGNENAAYQGRVNDWVNQDVERRVNNLPAFNSVYNTSQLSLNNYMVTEGGRSFNRNLITAMNVYNDADTKRAIARKWHDNPDMSTGEFNRMANSVVVGKIQDLAWNANYMGDWGTYLGQNPVPGLRYPDTQEDVDYNANVIRQTASQLPFLLNASIQN